METTIQESPNTTEIAEPKERISNFERWRSYCDGLTSPDSFINFGFYYLISACLQRRVWCPPSHKPIYANQFMGFVAPPGIGKGLVTSEIARFLRHHKLGNPNAGTTTVTGNKETGTIETVDRMLMEAAAQADYNSGTSEERRSMFPEKKYQAQERPLLFPVAADATTYEALVTAIGRALRRKNYSEYDQVLGRNITKIYTHSSIAFCLEEVVSLFRRKTEDTVYFLQQAYDCGDYKKDTKTQGVDRIHNCCVSLISGTTPKTMRKVFRDELLNEGYASRSIFVFEPRDRKSSVFIPELSVHQRECQETLLNHIYKLSQLFGQVSIPTDAEEWLEIWWKQTQTNRPNINERLIDYYARKKIHVIKMAMAIHFGESTSMSLCLDEFQHAVKLLDAVEKRMHHALISESQNPYYQVGKKILQWIKDTHSRSLKELLAKFWEDLPTSNPREAMDKIVEHYLMTGKLVPDRTKGSELYDVIRESTNSESELD